MDSDSTDQFDNSYSHQDGERLMVVMTNNIHNATTTEVGSVRHFSPFFADDHHFCTLSNGYQESVDPVTGLPI